jgi:hypothetical protein
MTSTSKGSELAIILRKLADHLEHRPDDELVALLFQAEKFVRNALAAKKNKAPSKSSKAAVSVDEISQTLQALPSRQAGEDLLREKISNREGLEKLARFLQLPVQRDDTIERLRTKIVENAIGSRLRSDAIQGDNR